MPNYIQLGRPICTHLPDRSPPAIWPSETMVGGEVLRGRTGGAVTLAVGMSFILTDAAVWFVNRRIHGLLKYWYHFAIMFEAVHSHDD